MEPPEVKLARAEARLSRLKAWVIALAAIVVFFGVVVPVAVVVFQQDAVERSSLAVTCASARANVFQLEALAALEERLGIPVDFSIPEVPDECAGS